MMSVPRRAMAQVENGTWHGLDGGTRARPAHTAAGKKLVGSLSCRAIK